MPAANKPAVSEHGLHVADDLDLPIDLVVQKTAILARSGSGKTNTAVDIVEELLEAKQQVVILDPPGAWWGLRSSGDGKRAGYPVAVLGGIHGDVPLEPAAGAIVADLLVDEALSAVLDLSEFTDGEIARFVATFAQRLYARKNTVRDPLMLVMEEADELAPQNLPGREKGEGGQALMLHHIERIAKRGRMRGIGVLAITQRSASLNKHVLSQVELLIAMQTTAPQDIAAINDWVREHGDQERQRQLIAEIAGLPVGTGFIWSPSWLRTFRKVAFRKRRTFDSSATPEPGKRQVAPKTLADVDLQALQQRMAATIEKAKADDPPELRRRIAELERQLKARPTEPQAREPDPAAIDRAVASATAPLLHRIRDVSAELEAFASGASRRLNELSATLRGEMAASLPTSHTPVPRIDPVPREHKRPATANAPAPRPEQQINDDWKPAAVHQRILDALATFEALGVTPAPRTSTGALAGYSAGSGHFKNSIGALRGRGLIVYPDGDSLALTDAGRAVAVPDLTVQTRQDLHDAWYRLLDKAQAAILRVLIDTYPDAVSREELGERTGYSHTSGHFKNVLGSLRTMKLAAYPDSNSVVATDLLFPALPRHA